MSTRLASPSGSHAHGHELIVDRPELQRRPRRLLYSTLTLVAWAVWIYLWLPLVTLVAWYFGLRVFLREIVVPDPRTMILVGVVYAAVVFVLGGALLVWSRYNVRRFRGKERREDAPPLADADIRDWFGIDAETLERFRHAGSMVVEHDDAGHVLDSTATPEAIRDPAPIPV